MPKWYELNETPAEALCYSTAFVCKILQLSLIYTNHSILLYTIVVTIVLRLRYYITILLRLSTGLLFGHSRYLSQKNYFFG